MIATRRGTDLHLRTAGALSGALLATSLVLSSCGTTTEPTPSTPAPTTPGPVPAPPAATSEDATTEETTTEESTTEETAEESTTEESTVEESTAEESTTEETTTEDATGSQAAPDGKLTLTGDAIEGVALSGPVDQVVAAIEAEIGAPTSTLEVARDCNGSVMTDHWSWDGLELTDLDGDLRWHVFPTLEEADLPEGLQIGAEEAAVRQVHQVTEETRTGGGSPVLVLEDGMAVTLDPATMTVSDVTNRYTQPC